MTTLNDLRDKMVDRAIKLLDHCDEKDEVDIFKAVTAFYSAAMKVGGKVADPPPGGGFPELQRRLAAGAATLDVPMIPPRMAAKVNGGSNGG